MQVLLQVAQEGREEGTFGRSSGVEDGLEARPLRASSTSCPEGCGPFLPAEEAPGLQARRRSALTIAPRCLPTGRGCLHHPAPAPVRPRRHRRESGASLPTPGPRLPSPRSSHHRARKPPGLSPPRAPGQLTRRSRGVGGPSTGGAGRGRSPMAVLGAYREER